MRPRWRACPGGRLTRGGGVLPRALRGGCASRRRTRWSSNEGGACRPWAHRPGLGVVPTPSEGGCVAPGVDECAQGRELPGSAPPPIRHACPPQAAPRHIAHLRRNRTGYNSPDARDAKENSGLDQGGGPQDVQHHPRLHIFTSPRAPVTTARPQYSAAIPPLPPVPGTPRCATRLGTPLTPGRGPESVACPQVRLQCPGRVARRTASPLLLARTSAGGRRSEWRLTKGSALLRLTIVRSERS